MGLPNLSVKKPVLVTVVFVGFLLLGILAAFRLPVELYQGTSSGIISIIIRARGGLAPVEVEHMITRPVEESVSTVSRLKTMYSNSREAESRVTLEFEPGTDMNFAALEVREKFSRVKSKLPPEIEKPVIANYSESESAVIVFAVISDTKTPEELREMVETDLKPWLERVDGVASVEIYGGRERKILVELDRDKMVAYSVSVEQVMDVLGASNINLLAGDYERGEYDFAVRTMGAFTSIDEIGNIGVKVTRQGSIIPLKEVATIKDSYLEPEDYARLNLNQNVSIYIKKTSLANTIKVVKLAKQVVKGYADEKVSELRIITVSDRAHSIERAIGDVRGSLILGVFLVTLMIYFALRSPVLALIISTAIPISVISTFLFMDFFGISLNVMTLSGLALSIGIMVDSAVVVMENVFKKREEGLSHEQAVREGSEEMWIPLLAASVTNLVVFLPIIFIDKEIQLIYQGFAFTVCISQVMSLLVAIMLIPMLLSKINFDVPSKPQESPAKPNFISKFYFWYEQLIRASFRLRYLMLSLIVMLFVASAWGLAHRDIDLPSTLEENEFQVVIFPLAGAKLETNDEVVKKIEEMLGQYKEVDLISTTVRKDDIRIFVRLVPRAKRSASKDVIMSQIKEKGNEEIKQVHEEYSLIVDEGASSEESKKMIINIFGLENETLEKLAHEFAKKINSVKGLTNLVMTDLRKRPEYSLVVDRARAAFYGLNVREVADSIHAQIRGMRPTKYHELTEGLEIETITRLQPIFRQKIDDLRNIFVVSPQTGVQVALEQFSSFYPSTGPQTIDRRNKYRYVFLKGDVNRPLETVGKEIKEAVKDVPMPKDYFWRFGGQYESLLQGRSELWLAFVITVVLIYMVLACMFQSFSEPVLVMIAIPLASIGVWLALTLTQKPLSQPVFIGMILLAGYVVNNSIILIDRINHLKKHIRDRNQILVKAGLDRLRPIMMTTGSTLIGFLPMAIAVSDSSELWSPLAVTVIGGLLTSTILTLFVIPNMFLYFSDLTRLFRTEKTSKQI